MWLLLITLSCITAGFYDASKKQSLKDNAVFPVLLLNTLFSSLLLVPWIVLSANGFLTEDSIVYTAPYCWEQQKFILVKSCIVLSSWIFGYIGLKYLPITIVGPINATRPIMVILGALTLFSEKLNLWQIIGVVTAIVAFYLLSCSGKKEGIDFKHNKWIVCIILSNIFGACSALYDKYLIIPPELGGLGINKMSVLCWFNIYQFFMMIPVVAFLWWPNRKNTTPFKWKWSIPLISIFISFSDFAYFYALTFPGALLSVMSMIRRSSVVISFLCGALIFHEKNLKSKALDLLLVLLALVFLYFGSK